MSDAAMTDTLPLAPGDYARTVTFCDPIERADDGTDWPLHVLGGDRKMHQLDVLIDGDLIPGVKDAALEFGRDVATLVTLHIDPTLCDVEVPTVNEDGFHVPGRIAGHAVLSPDKAGAGVCDCADSPWAYDSESGTVACVMFVARVVFE